VGKTRPEKDSGSSSTLSESMGVMRKEWAFSCQGGQLEHSGLQTVSERIMRARFRAEVTT